MLKNLLHVGFLLVLVVVAAGCVTSQSNVSPDFKLNASGTTGILAGSITYLGPYAGYRVSYRSIGNQSALGAIQTGEAVTLLPRFSRGDTSLLGNPGDLFAIELPVGDYEFFTWHVGSGYAHVRASTPFNIRFTVSAGKITYVGNFHFQITSRLGLMVTGAELNHYDFAERDVPLIKRQYPGLDSNEIQLAIARDTRQRGVGGDGNTTITTPVIIPPVIRAR